MLLTVPATLLLVCSPLLSRFIGSHAILSGPAGGMVSVMHVYS